MTKLSVNINKIATIRNARGGNVPNICQVAIDCERFGAEGITPETVRFLPLAERDKKAD